MIDGMSVCEFITYVLTCGKSENAKPIFVDDYDYDFELSKEDMDNF